MIVRPKPNLLDIAFAMRGTILTAIWGRLAMGALVSGLAVLATRHFPGALGPVSGFPFTLIGLALSIFMSFRNSSCFARWWEARMLWGALIATCRSLARLCATLPEEARQSLLRGACSYAGGLAARLRGRDEAAAIARWCPDALAAAVPINGVNQQMGALTQRLLAEGRLQPMHWSAIEGELQAMNATFAGCERIANTPVPFTYSLLLHRTAHAFCLVLPFALAGTLGWWTILAETLVCYTFFGLDELADQLEEPFGTEPNDLALDAMVRVIERDMLSALGEAELPPLLRPVRDLLL